MKMPQGSMCIEKLWLANYVNVTYVNKKKKGESRRRKQKFSFHMIFMEHIHTKERKKGKINGNLCGNMNLLLYYWGSSVLYICMKLYVWWNFMTINFMKEKKITCIPNVMNQHPISFCILSNIKWNFHSFMAINQCHVGVCY